MPELPGRPARDHEGRGEPGPGRLDELPAEVDELLLVGSAAGSPRQERQLEPLDVLKEVAVGHAARSPFLSLSSTDLVMLSRS